MKNDIVKQFIELVKIPSPTGEEEGVRTYLTEKLSKNGWNVGTDKSGNLIAFKDKKAKLWLVAHMDTVLQKGQKVVPIINKNTISSDGSTILGADNKVGIAILLDLAMTNKQFQKCAMVFTVNEEEGEMGSAKIDWSDLCPELILNIDGSEEVGVINDSGMGQIVFEIEVFGKSAHAAKHPQEGINAIAIAAEIICKIKQGSDDDQNTCNIGKIAGGTATNVVSDHVSIIGEIRSFSKVMLEKKWNNLVKLCNKIAIKHGAKCMFTNKVDDGVPVWEKKLGSKYHNVIVNAAKLVEVELKFEKMFACSDANFLSNSAEVFSINHGGSKAHSVEESIKVSEIISAKKFVGAIVSSFNQSIKI